MTMDAVCLDVGPFSKLTIFLYMCYLSLPWFNPLNILPFSLPVFLVLLFHCLNPSQVCIAENFLWRRSDSGCDTCLSYWVQARKLMRPSKNKSTIKRAFSKFFFFFKDFFFVSSFSHLEPASNSFSQWAMSTLYLPLKGHLSLNNHFWMSYFGLLISHKWKNMSLYCKKEMKKLYSADRIFKPWSEW